MRITRTWLFLLTAVCICSPLQAQPASGGATARHTLWKVQGQHNNVYLLGSIHVLKKSDYPLAAPMEAAFSNSGVAVFETDIAALEDPAIAMKLLSKARLPDGETLAKQLSPAVYKMFTNHVNSSGMPLGIFESLTPALAVMTLEMIEMQKLGLEPGQGVDKHFFPKARAAGKEIVPLETVDFQIKLLTDFTRPEGELLMKTSLEELENLKKDLAEMLTAWKTGDAAELEKLLNKAKEQAPAIYQRLLTDRNRNWIPRIIELARGNKDAVVIVGAGHLVGKEGVVELLRGRGLKVTQE